MWQRLWNVQEHLPSPQNLSRPNQGNVTDERTNSAAFDDNEKFGLEEDVTDPMSIEQVIKDLMRNNESLSELHSILQSMDPVFEVRATTETTTTPASLASLEEKDDLNEKDRQIDLYKQRVDNLEHQLDTMKSRQNAAAVDLAANDREKWQEDVRSRDKEIENLKNQLSAAAAENASVTKAVQDKDQQINILRRLDEGRNRWVTGFTRASESVHSAGDKQGENEMVDATRRISQLRWEIEQYSSRTSQLEANLKLKQKEVEDMNCQIDELVASLDIAERRISEQNAQIEEMQTLKTDLANKQTELESKNNEINSLMEDIMSLNEQNDGSRDEDKFKEMNLLARAKDERIAQLDTSVSELKRKLALCERDCEEERDEFVAQLEAQRNELEQKEDMLNSAADKVCDLEDMVDTLQEELHDLEQQSQQREPNSHEADGVCAECRDTIEELKKELVTTQQALEEAVDLAESQKHRYQEIISEQDQDLESLSQALKSRDESNGDRPFSSIPRPKVRPPGINSRASTSFSSRRKSADLADDGLNLKRADNQDMERQMQKLIEERDRLETHLREKDSLLSDKDKDLMQYAHMVEALRRDTVGLRNELEDTQDELNRLVAAETLTDRTSHSRISDPKV